jgi:hypothetical protein
MEETLFQKKDERERYSSREHCSTVEPYSLAEADQIQVIFFKKKVYLTSLAYRRRQGELNRPADVGA